MSEPPTPPTDEYAAFRRLAEKLVAVPKKEVDEQRTRYDEMQEESRNKRRADARPLDKFS